MTFKPTYRSAYNSMLNYIKSLFKRKRKLEGLMYLYTDSSRTYLFITPGVFERVHTPYTISQTFATALTYSTVFTETEEHSS